MLSICRDWDDGETVEQARGLVKLVKGSLCSFDQYCEVFVLVVVKGLRETLRKITDVGGETDGAGIVAEAEGGEDVCGCCVDDGGVAEGFRVAGCGEKVLVIAVC